MLDGATRPAIALLVRTVREVESAQAVPPAARSIRAGGRDSNTYWDWLLSHAYVVYAMQAVVAGQIENFQKFPPRQKPASFNLDAVMSGTLEETHSSAGH